MGFQSEIDLKLPWTAYEEKQPPEGDFQIIFWSIKNSDGVNVCRLPGSDEGKAIAEFIAAQTSRFAVGRSVCNTCYGDGVVWVSCPSGELLESKKSADDYLSICPECLGTGWVK